MSDEWRLETPKMNDDKSWKLLEKAVLAGVQEQRRARRWGIFFRSLIFIYLFVVLLAFSPFGSLEKSASRGGSHTALIEVKGMIADDGPASTNDTVTALCVAFKDEDTRGIVLRINSPGGSPVQSGYIYDEIRRLHGERPNVKVHAVISDLGASGAYYIVNATDQIYAGKASLVDSTDVTAANFGFVDTMEKFSVERHVCTPGEHKSLLDPFQPQKPEKTQFWRQVLDAAHKQFIDSMKKGRGDRFKVEGRPEPFPGLVWSGEQALQLGLIDGLGNASYMARKVVKKKKIENYTVQESPFDRFAKKFGASVTKRLALWTGWQGPVLR